MCIRDRVDVLRLDKSIDLAFLKPADNDKKAEQTATRRAVAILRMFFDVTEKGQKTTSDCTRKRIFTLKKLPQFRVHSFTSKASQTTTYADIDKFDRIESEIVDALVECPF